MAAMHSRSKPIGPLGPVGNQPRMSSVAAAEKVWGVPAPRRQADAPSIGVRPMTQLTQDGEWRKLVADYRLFLDDLLREKYSAARQLVRTIDRIMRSASGCRARRPPPIIWDNALPYDFYGLANAVDIWEPNVWPDRELGTRRPALSRRLCAPVRRRKPLIWRKWDTPLGQ